MKKLILFRHGKSRWDAPNDRERDLETRGVERTQKSAKVLISKLDFAPQKCFSSPALRARKTAEEAINNFSQNIEIQLNENLYTFSFFDLLKEIKKFGEDFDSAILFGHNEAFTEFANRMGDVYLEHLPTSGAVWLEFDAKNWKEIEKGKTRLIIKPKEIK